MRKLLFCVLIFIIFNISTAFASELSEVSEGLRKRCNAPSSQELERIYDRAKKIENAELINWQCDGETVQLTHGFCTVEITHKGNKIYALASTEVMTPILFSSDNQVPIKGLNFTISRWGKDFEEVLGITRNDNSTVSEKMNFCI